MDYQHMEIPLQENMEVEGKNPNLKPQFLRDSYLMEDFIRRVIQEG